VAFLRLIDVGRATSLSTTRSGVIGTEGEPEWG
jgi:hypothetical protein